MSHTGPSLATQILDNMDGKQARKTGTSSPLGLLFDHGCDALNATVVSGPSWRRSDQVQQHPRRTPSPAQLGPLTLFSAVGLSAASWAAPLGWSLAATGFYVSTWEEFHTGEFELPLINGPNEGIVIFVLGYLASAVLGPEWWHTPCCEVGGVTLMPLHGLLGFFAVALVATLTDSVTIILNRAHQPRNLTAEEVAAGMRVDVSMCAAWGRMLPVAAYWGVAFAGHYLAPHVVNWCPFLWYTTLGVAFTVLVTKLMLSHVAVEPFRPALVPLVALALIPAVATLRSQGLLHVWSETEDIAVYVALALLVWALSAHHIVTSIITLSVGLDVPVFTIRPKAH